MDLKKDIIEDGENAEKIFKIPFLVEWMLTTPIKGAKAEDEFGMYMAGNEL